MARASQAELDAIIREISIQRLVEARGAKLARRGVQLTGPCPFHRSSKPTLTIDPKNNTWACTGRCKVKAGTVIEWTMRVAGVSRKHAVELLRSGSMISAPPPRPSLPRRAPPRSSPSSPTPKRPITP